MQSLIFGLGAALAWGLHDFCVRHLSQRIPAAPMLLAVLIAGSLVLAPVSVLVGGWDRLTMMASGLAVVSGLCYAIAAYGLYRAFAIGPVRLVAPICGAYPVLSFGFAALAGREIDAAQWLAVLAVVAGIALVARAEEGSDAAANRPAAIGWAVLAATGFALTFAVGQVAAKSGAELPVTLLTRFAAMALIGGGIVAARVSLAPLRPHLPLLGLMGVLDVTALSLVLAAGGLSHPEYAAVASSIFGIITILLAWRFLREAMRPIQWAGVVCVFAGVGWLAAT